MNNKEFLNEEKFSCQGMELEERDLCLKYLGLTKEFEKAIILRSKLYKDNGKYILNGIACIECNNEEFYNITFESEIIVKKDIVSVFSNITHLYGKDINLPQIKILETCDKFSKKNDKLIQQTYYFNPDNKFEFEYDIPNDFDKFYELSKFNNQKYKQR